jgi:spore coat protein U-like protein
VKIATGCIIVVSILVIANMACAGDTGVLSVSAVIISKGNCRFNSSTSALNFGSLDPGNAIDRNGSTTVVFKCTGNGNAPITFAITDDGGLYKTGPNAPRMRHTTQLSEYLPYTLSYSPSSGSVPKNTNQNLAVSSTVKGTDYENAYAGNYSDTVILAINP